MISHVFDNVEQRMKKCLALSTLMVSRTLRQTFREQFTLWDGVEPKRIESNLAAKHGNEKRY